LRFIEKIGIEILLIAFGEELFELENSTDAMLIDATESRFNLLDLLMHLIVA
jgi:hypothetical protein